MLLHSRPASTRSSPYCSDRATPSGSTRCAPTTGFYVFDVTAATAPSTPTSRQKLRCTHRLRSYRAASCAQHDARLGHARIAPVILEPAPAPYSAARTCSAPTFPRARAESQTRDGNRVEYDGRQIWGVVSIRNAQSRLVVLESVVVRFRFFSALARPAGGCG
jgi:hypothetical protein